MTARIEKMRQRLTEALTPASLEIADDSAQHQGHGGYDAEGSHFSIAIVSPLFQGKNTVERHRLVYAALGDMMQREIHALRISARSTDEL
jgi:BolA protein